MRVFKSFLLVLIIFLMVGCSAKNKIDQSTNANALMGITPTEKSEVSNQSLTPGGDSAEGINNNKVCTYQNKVIKITVSSENGAILGLSDIKRGIDYFSQSKSIPFAIDCGSGLKSDFQKFSIKEEKTSMGQKVLFCWEINNAITLNAQMYICDDGSIQFTSNAKSCGKKTISVVKYPIINGFTTITPNGDQDFVTHSFATGVEVQNPYKNFANNGDGFPLMPYPESFSGAAMQFLTFYGKNVGGLYFAALDGSFRQKWLNFSKNKDHLEFSHMYGYQDLQEGNVVIDDYPVIIQTVNGNGWEDAADLYRDWAVKQVWCQNGRLVDKVNSQKPVWLLENTGLSTFGINASYDRSLWLDEYHKLTDTNIFHVTGPDWPKHTQDYRSNLCGGYDDWFPVNFNSANLETIKNNGDFLAPFEFDLLANMSGADNQNLLASAQKFPKLKYSQDSYNFTMLCPEEPYTKNLHISRDVELYKESNCNAIYYDISANNLLHVCVNQMHKDEHKMGDDTGITVAYRDIFKSTRDAVSKEAGIYIPLGTEMMNEVFLDSLDFYQARSWGRPASFLELGSYEHMFRDGTMKSIPMFTYVYHEYGGTRLDGWGKLTDKIGDLYYFTAARTYLWGAIYELNYEWSPMEVLNGRENPSSEHYFTFAPQGYQLTEERGRYLAQFAALRTGIGNKYLAYGRMERTPEFDAPFNSYYYFHYNCPEGLAEYNISGNLTETSVVSSAWTFDKEGNHSAALMFSNCTKNEINIMVNLDTSKYSFIKKAEATLYSGFKDKDCQVKQSIGNVSPGTILTINIKLEPLTVYMLEIK